MTNKEQLQVNNNDISTVISDLRRKATELDVTAQVNTQIELLDTLEDTIDLFPDIPEKPIWEPDADMKWAKKVCEDDVQEGFAYKVLQMIDNSYSYTDIVVPSNGAVKTSDGGYYTSNAKHTWDDTNARQSAVGDYKVRWLIYYTNTQNIGTSISLLDDVIYACFDGVYFGKIFSGKGHLQYFDVINDANPYGVFNAQQMFYNCYSLKTIPLMNTININTMSYMFHNCSSLMYIPLLNTQFVSTMSFMFLNCYSLQTIPLLDTHNVLSMEQMFYGCYSLKSIPLLDTSKVTNMNGMFNSCYSLQTIPMLNMSTVTNSQQMFYNCYSLQTIPLLDTGKVTNMNQMFYGCRLFKATPLIPLDSVTTMNEIFRNCYLLKSATLNLNSITSSGRQNNIFNGDDVLEFLNLTNIKWSLVLTNSTLYSRETLLGVINNLVDLSGGTAQTLTIGSTNRAKLTEDDILIATNKNWTIA